MRGAYRKRAARLTIVGFRPPRSNPLKYCWLNPLRSARRSQSGKTTLLRRFKAMKVSPPRSRPIRPIFYFEELTEGMKLDLGTIEPDESDIIAFARQYDPQPFHLDGAEELTASGWQIGAMGMRLLCEGLLLGSGSMISPGIEEMRWFSPVHAGDLLSGHAVVDQLRRSNSKPDIGIVSLSITLERADGQLVMRSRQNVFWKSASTEAGA
jgi:acyl dehydratase